MGIPFFTLQVKGGFLAAGHYRKTFSWAHKSK